ncbi:hypothetical protein CRENBAI_011124 [Crenichthys baileyi]|uniref:Uncharacterized protein n=1 Tax=Crenichthys baileyi TaxID=28760 RepID=A0AAV9R4D7_9TELE
MQISRSLFEQDLAAAVKVQRIKNVVQRYQLQPLAGPPGTDGPACTVTCSATTRLLQFSPGCDLPPPACSSSCSGRVHV